MTSMMTAHVVWHTVCAQAVNGNVVDESELRGAKHSGVKIPFNRRSRCKLLVFRARNFSSGAKEDKRELSE